MDDIFKHNFSQLLWPLIIFSYKVILFKTTIIISCCITTIGNSVQRFLGHIIKVVNLILLLKYSIVIDRYFTANIISQIKGFPYPSMLAWLTFDINSHKETLGISSMPEVSYTSTRVTIINFNRNLLACIMMHHFIQFDNTKFPHDSHLLIFIDKLPSIDTMQHHEAWST